MADNTKKAVKRYASRFVKEIQREIETQGKKQLRPLDTAKVIRVKPQIIIEALNRNVQYEEDDILWQIDPANLSKGDIVTIGRDGADQPIVIGVLDGNDPTTTKKKSGKSSDGGEQKEYEGGKTYGASSDTEQPENKAAPTWKGSRERESQLPKSGNRDGDIRLVSSKKQLFQWVEYLKDWKPITGDPASSGLDLYVNTTGDTMTGDLVMDAGTMITLPDAPVDPTDVTNKDYVDTQISGVSLSSYVPVVTTSVNYAVLPTDQLILVDTSGGARTITLPATHVSGKVYEIKDCTGNAFTNNITVDTADTDLVDGLATFTIAVNKQAVRIVSDGSNWFVV